MELVSMGEGPEEDEEGEFLGDIPTVLTFIGEAPRVLPDVFGVSRRVLRGVSGRRSSTRC